MTGFRESAGGKTYTGSDGESDRPFAAEQSDLWSLDIDAPSSAGVGSDFTITVTANFSGSFVSSLDPEKCRYNNSDGIAARLVVREGSGPELVGEKCVPTNGSREFTHTTSTTASGPNEFQFTLVTQENRDTLANATTYVEGTTSTIEPEPEGAQYELRNFNVTPNTVSPTGTVDTSVDIENVGDQQENITLTWTFSPQSAFMFPVRREANTAVRPGDTNEFTSSFDALDFGLLDGITYDVYATADGVESSRQELVVSSDGGGDGDGGGGDTTISASDIALSCPSPPSELEPGEDVLFETRVTNNGSIAADVTVNWSANNLSIASDTVTVSAGGGATAEGGPVGYGAFETLVGAGTDATITAEISQVDPA